MDLFFQIKYFRYSYFPGLNIPIKNLSFSPKVIHHFCSAAYFYWLIATGNIPRVAHISKSNINI